MTDPRGSQAGWVICRSITAELDYALASVGEYYPPAVLTPDLRTLGEATPQAWRQEWPVFLGAPRPTVSLLTYLAGLDGLLLEPDYSRATLSLRDLTLQDTLELAAARARQFGLEPDAALVPAERLTDLMVRLEVAVHRASGIPIPPSSHMPHSTAADMRRTVPVLKDGALHSRFWHWVDRFFYETYQPWRESRLDVMRALGARAAAALGASERTGEAPNLDWLTAQSPLRSAGLREAVESGRLRAGFWVEPFGLFDAITLQPGLALVSFAEPGPLFEGFRSAAADVAVRVKALSDPTRLIILRIIRHYGMDNTRMAEYLELARPTVSVHAKILREAGLIETVQEGRESRHTLRPTEVRRLFADLDRFLDLPKDSGT
ncbi:MAG: ArsR/SmtB family transcription factor [Symbiobacteriia bacterium]